MTHESVVTENLRRSFGDVVAVDGVDLSVAKGEIYGFLGPNGAGKSTFVRMLTTLMMPSSGRAMVAGRDVVKDPIGVRLRIGAALQDAALDPKQTGLELLELQGRLYGLSKNQARKRIGEVESLVGIGSAIGRQIGTYSGGMKRRLDLAASLIHNPEVLFLDEPTTGLDPNSRSWVWEEVRRINIELGVTVFLTTQYLEEADVLARRVGIINHGRLAVEGTPEDLKRSMGSDVIVAQIDGDATIASTALASIRGVTAVDVYEKELSIKVTDGPRLISSVAVTLNESAVHIRELTLRTPTLDDVFLHVTGDRMTQQETVLAEGERL